MNAFQTKNITSQGLEREGGKERDLDVFPDSLNRFQQSTLWIGNAEETPIASITIYQTETDLILKVGITDIHLVKLNLEITPETILIEGEPTRAAGVEGYFRPHGFENLIPLPHPVQPETCWTEIQRDGLKIKLAKQLGVPLSKVRMQLANANSDLAQT